MSSLGRFGLIAVFASLLALVAAQPALATGGGGGGTRSLTGEEFLVNDVNITADCHPDSTSTVRYSATGPAVGPYPGTFFVAGTARIAPQTFAGQRPGTVAGPLLSVTEFFAVFSPLATIAGRKTLAPDLVFDSSQGTCMEVTDFPVLDVTNGTGTVIEVATQLRYNATIHEPGGRFHDSGDALLSFTEIDVTGACPTGTCRARVAGFDQFFMQSDPAPPDDDDD